MKKQHTFKNLSTLKETQVSVKSQLGEKYDKVIAPYIQIIEMVMKANAENGFEAMKRIKDTLPIYKKTDAPLLFSAALIEITEAKHFQGFINSPMISPELEQILDNKPPSFFKKMKDYMISDLKSQ